MTDIQNYSAHAPAPKFGLTQRQQDALDAIKSLIVFNRVSPSLDEIAEVLEVSKPRVVAFLHELERRGHISRTPYAHRSIQIIEAA